MKPRYKIVLTQCYWECGDGCCSESGYKVEVVDNQEDKTIHQNDEWRYLTTIQSGYEDGFDFLKQHLGRKPREGKDYTVVDENDLDIFEEI
jgi:hypothetical protein